VSLNKDDCKEKISQSRGLELFSKIYIKENCELIEKIR
jgi:hypothetical protein